MDHDAVSLLLACYRAGVAAARPEPAVRRALGGIGFRSPPWVLAIGKAAGPMARAALETLPAVAGGLVVGPADDPVPPLPSLAGDHPLPGPRSTAAGRAVGDLARRIPPGAEVLVLLSGGATSLIAAPAGDLSPADLRHAFEVLLGSGLDIAGMNAVRKRLARWGGGRLAVALGHTRVVQLLVSDVPGDDPASIGSGPCVPERATTPAVLASLRAGGHWESLPAGARRHLEAMAEGDPALDLPLPDHAALAACETAIIATNAVAREAAAAEAGRLGCGVHRQATPITGEAAAEGERLAGRLLAVPPGPDPTVLVWGGEPTVTLAGGPGGRGGRCQELALAAARTLRGRGSGVALLAAGTDGRDGPTDAAGAVVNGDTWEAIRGAGRDPGRALARHDAYPALEAAGALVRTGPTGTNVMDLVLGWVAPV